MIEIEKCLEWPREDPAYPGPRVKGSIWILEDILNLPSLVPGAVAHKARQRLPLEQDATGLCPKQTADGARDCRLSAAGLTHESQCLAFSN